MSAINFNWFYHNNCPEFQNIKARILEYKQPTQKQLENYKRDHKQAHIRVIDELKTLMEGPFDPTSECGWQLCEDPCSICEQNGHSFVYWYFSYFYDL